MIFTTGLLLLNLVSGDAITGVTAQFRLRGETRDDRHFKQLRWGDRDLHAEYRLRAAATLQAARYSLWLELQDQRIAGSQPPRILDTAPTPMRWRRGDLLYATDRERLAGDIPVTSKPRDKLQAGTRLAGVLGVAAGKGSFKLGTYAVEAAGGRLLGHDEARDGYRPLAVGYVAENWLVWGGIDGSDELTGPAWIGLVKREWRWRTGGLETGLIGHRISGLPLHRGIDEAVVSPYVSGNIQVLRWLRFEATGAAQLGSRWNGQRGTWGERVTLRETQEGEELTFWDRATTAGVAGERPHRSVQSGLLHVATAVTPPLGRKSPTLEAGFDMAGGGHSKTIDHTFVPYRFDTHRFFGNAGYVGEENARIASLQVSVPLSSVWSARVKFLKVDVMSPLHGLVFENGDRLDPAVFTPSRYAGLHSKHAFNEYDASLVWQPHPKGMSVTLAYSEVRPGQYTLDAVRNGIFFRASPIQWAGVTLDVPIE